MKYSRRDAGNCVWDDDPAVQYGQCNNCDPANTESIEMFKDADATAIYGPRAA